MFYVYRFLDKKKNIIYVGKSKQDLEQRFRGHLHLPDACYDLTYKIEYIECATESDMSIKEIYYINRFRHDGVFFNILDTMDAPMSVEFNDKWKQYKGPLGAHFHHSINYIKGYTSKKETRYNKDGSVDRRRPNSKKGVSTYVDALTADEVELVANYLIDEINRSENGNQEQIRFRNFVIFILGVNLPHKMNDFLSLRYCDLFDKGNKLRSVELKLNRFRKDEIIEIPLKDIVKKSILAYVQYNGWSYNSNADDPLFQTREHQIVSSNTWWRILNSAIDAVGIKKNVGTESLRKTYGLNIYSRATDKLSALQFLGEIFGHEREGTIIKYLNLTDSTIDYDYYLGETFSLADVDLSKIECLKPGKSVMIPKAKQATMNKVDRSVLDQTIPEKKPVQKLEKEPKTNRLWPKEKKLEVVLKYLDQHIPQIELAKQYGVDSANISRWVSEYKKYGASVFVDKRFKDKEPIIWYVDTSPKESRTNKVWTKEVKLEIVKKNLVQHIPQNALAKEYGVPAGNISRWVSEYQRYGETAFEDKRLKNK